MLTEAERLVATGDHAAARDLLLAHPGSQLPKSLQPRHEVALARADLGLGEAWDTFLVLRDFADRYPHSELREQVVDLLFQAGSQLAASDAGFLFFWSARRGGVACLQHLITRYPESQHLADALRILGEIAFADGDFTLAQDRFRELLVRRPESEWVPLARFRFAMSIVASLHGPDYDLDQMRHATHELRDFMANPPENPEFMRQAQAALARLLEWQAERYLRVATFYADIGNRPGELDNLRKAAAPEFAATAAAATARERVAARTEPPPGPGQ